MSTKFPFYVFNLLIVLLLSTACAGGADEVPATLSPLEPPESPVPTPLPDEATLAARIRARGYLRVGVRYDLQPFCYITDEGKVAGFDVDLGRELARRWLGDADAVHFRQVRSDTAIAHLQSDSAEDSVDIVIAALTHTKDREAGADFSLPYFIDGQALLVRAPGTISGRADLAGRPVGVTVWGEARSMIEETTPFTIALQSYDRFDTAMEALGQGEVEAVADLRRRLFWGKDMLPGMDTAIVGQYTALPVAIAFPQNDSFFADLVNLTLQEMVVDGTYAGLYSRWFAPETPPGIERWPGAETISLSDAPLFAQAPDTIAAIQSRGGLKVAIAADRSPFAYVDASGTPAGYEIELMRLLTTRWLGDVTAVEFIPTPRETGIDLLRTGQADMLIGGLSHTRAAEMKLDFSLTTYVAGMGLMVQAGTPITDLVSLSGRQVAVIEGSGAREKLLAVGREAGISLVVLPQPSLEEAAALLQQGQVAAVAGDRAEMLGIAYATQGLGVLPLRLTRVPLAIGLPPGDSAFRDLVNLTLQAMKADGQFDNLYTTWFDDTPPPWNLWPGAPYRELRLGTGP